MTRLTVKQSAERVGVSESLIYQWCHERRLRHIRLGTGTKRGKILIEMTDLDAFLEGLRVEAGEAGSAAPGLRHIKSR
jgi:excisionase family DNA binding protein